MLICIVLLLCGLGVKAQKIQVVDTDGQPVAFVCVTSEKGMLIGTTDTDGWLDDVKGNTKLCLSHVAFNPKTVNIADVVDGKITLEDVQFDLPEVTVKPKELVYVQTYFRLIYFDDDGPIYYRAGVVDNAFDIKKRKMSSKDRTLARGSSGLIRFLISTLVGSHIDKWAHLDTLSTYDRILKRTNDGDLMLTAQPDGRQIVSDSICELGYIEDDVKAGLRTTSFNGWMYNRHKEEAEAKAKNKKKKKDDTPEADESYYQVYRIDSDGRSRISDFVMRQLQVVGTHRRQGGQYMILLQVYATDCDYVDKNEYKQLRKDNKVDMDIKELLQFEKNHKIPPLEPNIQKQIDLLFKKELSK